MAKSASDNPKEVDLDLERATHDHLHNGIVDTIYWEKISVKVQDKTTGNAKHLLHSINGAASAGGLIQVYASI